MTKENLGVSILGKSEWKLGELDDLLKFIQSAGGQKLTENLSGLVAAYDQISNSELGKAKMENPSQTLYSILKARDMGNNLLMLRDLFFNQIHIMDKYNVLYRKIEGELDGSRSNGDEGE